MFNRKTKVENRYVSPLGTKPVLSAGVLAKNEIMTMKKAALLAGIYAASAMNAINEITNPYDGLPEMRYNGNKQPERKTQLTKKQKKKKGCG